MKNKAINRVATLIEHFNIPINRFEREIDVSMNVIQSALKRGSSLKDEVLNKILDKYPEVSPLWLLRGEGRMLRNSEGKEVVKVHVENKSSSVNNQSNSPVSSGFTHSVEMLLEEKERYIRSLEKLLELYEARVGAELGGLKSETKKVEYA